MVYCYQSWVKWHNKTSEQLRQKLEALAGAKAHEKAGKAPKDSAQQDQERKQKLEQVGSLQPLCARCI